MGWIRSEVSLSRIKRLQLSVSMWPVEILSLDLKQPKNEKLVDVLWSTVRKGSNLPPDANILQMSVSTYNGVKIDILVQSIEWDVVDISKPIPIFEGQLDSKAIESILAVHKEYGIGTFANE